jgi:hypothetical protein
MGNEVVPAPESNAHVRMSDRDRDQVVTRLNQAVSEGRLTMDEFTERVDGVLAAKTFGDIAPLVADLPQIPIVPTTADQATFSARGSNIRRSGRWTVPSKLRIEARGAQVRLDFTQAVITASVVHIALKVHGCTVRFTVPPDCSVELGSMAMHGSTARCQRIATEPRPGSVHFVVTGEAHGSSVRARPPRAWKWPWEKQSPLEIAGR